jgi:hypothetical protein
MSETTGSSSGRASVVTGLFGDRESAERAYDALRNRGYGSDEISVLMSDRTRDKHFATPGERETEVGNKALEEAGTGGEVGTGAAIGGAVGGTLTAVAAIGTTLALPGFALLVAGPLAAELASAGAGGMTGGLLGLLVGSGLPEEQASRFDEGIRHGSILLVVNPRTDEDAEYFENAFDPHGTGWGENYYR